MRTMARIEPLRREEIPALAPVFDLLEHTMGFVPNSLLIMGRWPELAQAFAALAGVVHTGGRVPAPLKRLVAYVSSTAAGCRYCQAHTAHLANRDGVDAEKVRRAFEYETAEVFDEAERAALALAHAASISPPAVSDSHFERLRRHFDEDQILGIVAVIALFGWLNRWNDTLATPLEESPLAFARQWLTETGWQPGPHAPATAAPDRSS